METTSIAMLNNIQLAKLGRKKGNEHMAALVCLILYWLQGSDNTPPRKGPTMKEKTIRKKQKNKKQKKNKYRKVKSYEYVHIVPTPQVIPTKLNSLA
jgi:hypothetical protein